MSDKLKNIIEWGYCIAIAVVLAFIFRYFVGTPTIVRQRSMYPTLVEGQRLILNRTFRIGKLDYPDYGQIITFEAPNIYYYEKEYRIDQTNPVAVYYEYDENDRYNVNEPKNIFSKFVYYVLEIGKRSYIKRVIALPGDHVKIENGSVYLNGEKLDEPYISSDVLTKSEKFNDFIVPQGYVFAIGDNRNASTDCRNFGCIPLEKVDGFVVFRFWPLDTWGKINKGK